MRNRLDTLQDYLNRQGIAGKEYSTILTDRNGIVKSLAGFNMDVGLFRPVAGAPLSGFHPVFEGLFPLKESSLLLPNVETHPGYYRDIHLVKSDPMVWVILEDKTAIVNQFRPGLQEHNTRNLLLESALDSPINQLFSSLGYFVLREISPLLFQSIKPWPAWAYQTFAPEQVRFGMGDLTQAFPYLEVFTDKRPGPGIPSVGSDIWTTAVGASGDRHFRAWWIRADHHNYLVIKILEENEAHQEIIQKARMAHLDAEAISRSEQMARRLVEVKDQFVSIVSHDLRSPFISIISALDFLFEDPAFSRSLNEEQNEFLVYIHEECRRLLDYLDKLLNWTRLDTGKLQPVILDVELGDLVRLTRGQFEQRLAGKEIRFEVSIPENFIIKADPTLFSQVINNLVGNAIKFTPRGGTISIVAEGDPGDRTITVADTGVGIPKEKQEKLFREYEKHFTYGTEGEKGTGIGLSIVRKIVEVHGFSIHCDSDEGKGTRMIIRIP
jgi:signal transduction histidine kinase